MARLDGGIFSRPRGKTGGIVFGAARTRDGKAVTTRLLVRPSNPRTPAQQLQRRKFEKTLGVVRSWGPGLYQGFFNRTIGQLAGFQSMESILLGAFNNDGSFSAPPDTPTGSTFGWDEGELSVDETIANSALIGVERSSGNYPTGTKFHAFMVYSVTGDWNDSDDLVVDYVVDTTESEGNSLGATIPLPDEDTGQLLFGFFVEYPANSPAPKSGTRWMTSARLEIQDIKNKG